MRKKHILYTKDIITEDVNHLCRNSTAYGPGMLDDVLEGINHPEISPLTRT